MKFKPNSCKEIITVEDTSDARTDRTYIKFANGLSLSVINGRGSYGGSQGLFEIAPFDKEYLMDGSLLGFVGDDVLGHLTGEAVEGYITRLKSL